MIRGEKTFTLYIQAYSPETIPGSEQEQCEIVR